jgi:hypothetical protein
MPHEYGIFRRFPGVVIGGGRSRLNRLGRNLRSLKGDTNNPPLDTSPDTSDSVLDLDLPCRFAQCDLRLFLASCAGMDASTQGLQDPSKTWFSRDLRRFITTSIR